MAQDNKKHRKSELQISIEKYLTIHNILLYVHIYI